MVISENDRYSIVTEVKIDGYGGERSALPRRVFLLSDYRDSTVFEPYARGCRELSSRKVVRADCM